MCSAVGGDLEVRYWLDGSQLEEQLAAAMRKHLKLTDDKKAYIPFNASLGLAEDSKDNNPLLAERWQILSPVRNHEFGTTEINRKIQAKYRGGMPELLEGYPPLTLADFPSILARISLRVPGGRPVQVIDKLVGVAGFEPATPSSRGALSECAYTRLPRRVCG
jgi:hypothetical protein